MSSFSQVSMGEGQEKVAREKNFAAFINGGWVILQNCHLGTDYMNEVEETLTKTPEIHSTYRLWITCEITSRFPIGLLQMCLKVTLEPPAGLQASLHRTYTTMVTQETLDKVDHEKWRTLLYTVAVLHSIVQERRKFGAIGWCVPYEFNNSDLDASLLFLEKHLSSTILVGLPLTWNTIQYMIAEVQYGGRITDDLDRDLINTYAAKWFCDDIFKPSFTFNNYHADFNYQIPDALDIGFYREYIETIPPVDSPLIFGLHPNADITYRIKEAAEMLTTIIETQPKESSATVGKSVDEQVKESAKDLLGNLPPDLVEEVFRAQIQKLKGPPRMDERGFGAPLNIFLFQELQRLQNIITTVRTNLENLVMAIDGTVVLTVDLLEDLNCVFDTWSRSETCLAGGIDAFRSHLPAVQSSEMLMWWLYLDSDLAQKAPSGKARNSPDVGVRHLCPKSPHTLPQGLKGAAWLDTRCFWRRDLLASANSWLLGYRPHRQVSSKGLSFHCCSSCPVVLRYTQLHTWLEFGRKDAGALPARMKHSVQHLHLDRR